MWKETQKSRWFPGQAAMAAASCLFASTTLLALPVNYTETASGELSGQSIGAFDVGANTVAGSESFSSSGRSLDTFSFVIPAGLQLDSIVLSVFTTSIPTIAQGLVLSPLDSVALADRLGFLNLNSSFAGTDVLPSLLLSDPGKTTTAPLGSGVYYAFLSSVSTIDAYQYQFNVSAVPSATRGVPDAGSTLPLFVLSSLGLFLAQSCRSRKSRRGTDVLAGPAEAAFFRRIKNIGFPPHP